MPSVTRAENPEEELSSGEMRISPRVKIPVGDGTAVMEMTGPAVPENGLQAFGDWVLAALEQHADGADEARTPYHRRAPGTGLGGRRRPGGPA